MREECRYCNDRERAQDVARVAEPVHDRVPARSDAVADAGHGAIPQQAPGGCQEHEWGDWHLGDTSRQRYEVPYHRQQPAAEHAGALVARVPGFCPVEVRVGEEEVLAEMVHECPTPGPADDPRYTSPDDLAGGTDGYSRDEVQVPGGSQDAGEAEG